jgi:hypothetical protein
MWIGGAEELRGRVWVVLTAMSGCLRFFVKNHGPGHGIAAALIGRTRSCLPPTPRASQLSQRLYPTIFARLSRLAPTPNSARETHRKCEADTPKTRVCELLVTAIGAFPCEAARRIAVLLYCLHPQSPFLHPQHIPGNHSLCRL